MDKYIKQILLEENTIIVPKLGALTVTSIKTGEMMFLSYLNYDDGKLAKFISEQENISDEDARLKVKNFVDAVREKVDKGEVYNLGKLGHFMLKDGEVCFEDYAIYEDKEEETEDQIKIIEVEVPDRDTDNAVNLTEQIAEQAEVKPEVTVSPEIEETSSPQESILEPAEIASFGVEETVSLDETNTETVFTATSEVEETASPVEIEADPEIIVPLEVEETVPRSLDEILNIATPEEKVVTNTPEVEKAVEQTPITAEIVEIETQDQVVSKSSDEPKIEFLDVPATAIPDPVVSRSQQVEKVQVENSYIPKKSSIVSKEVKASIKQGKQSREETPKAVVEQKEKIKTEKIKTEKIKKEKKKKGAFFWILIVLLGLLFTGGVLTFMFYDQVKKYIPFIEKTEIKEQQQAYPDSIEDLNNSAEELEASENERISSENNEEQPADESIPAETVPAETIPEETNQKPAKEYIAPLASSSNGSYHVIVGAFLVQSNAERFVQKQGGSASIVQQGNWYMVSLSSHSTSAEANQAMDNLDKAWILVEK